MISNSHVLWDFFKYPLTVLMAERKTSICLAHILMTYRVQYLTWILCKNQKKLATLCLGFS